MSNFNTNLMGKKVTFDTHAPAILGARFSKVMILGISDYSSVDTFQPQTRHNEVYGYLPSGSEKQYNRINYIKVRDSNGNVMWFGESWINWTTLVEHDGRDTLIRITDLPPSQHDKLRRMLLNNNITNFEIEIVD